MRKVLVVLLVLCGALLAAPAVAQERTPVQVVEEIYRHYGDGQALGVYPTDERLRYLFSADLNELLDGERALVAAYGIGHLDFDPFVDGQDFDLDALDVRRLEQGADHARVETTFTNFGTPTRLLYHLVRENGAWRIDELESPDVGYAWRLTSVLRGQ